MPLVRDQKLASDLQLPSSSNYITGGFAGENLSCKICDSEHDDLTADQNTGKAVRHYEQLLRHYAQHDEDFHPLFAQFHLRDQTERKFPWYADPVYPGIEKSSRYQPLFFTVIKGYKDPEFECGVNIERLIKEPFRTHIWINNEEQKPDAPKPKRKPLRKSNDFTGNDGLKKIGYFGIPPELLDKAPDPDRKRFRCSCGEFRPYFATFVELFLFLCIHALGYHSKDQAACDAARADLKSFEKSTGITVFKKLPKRSFLLLFDFACDERLFAPYIWAVKVQSTGLSYFCILCFKFLHVDNLPDAVRHLANHDTERKRVIVSNKVFCIDEEHIGRQLPTAFQSMMHPYMFVRSNKNFYWMCCFCSKVLVADSYAQLFGYFLIHVCVPTNKCVWQTKGTKASFAWLHAIMKKFSTFTTLRTKLSFSKFAISTAEEEYCLRLERSLFKTAFLQDNRLIAVPKMFDWKNNSLSQKKPYYTMCPLCGEMFAPELKARDIPKEHNCQPQEF